MNNQPTEVINLSNHIKPKTVSVKYKTVPVVLKFKPSTSVKSAHWVWEITIISTTTYSEIADTEGKALNAAKKYIDKHKLGNQ